MLFKASQLMPPVKDPSPTTATTWRSFNSPVCSKARAIPSAQDKAVDAWEFSTMS